LKNDLSEARKLIEKQRQQLKTAANVSTRRESIGGPSGEDTPAAQKQYRKTGDYRENPPQHHQNQYGISGDCRESISNFGGRPDPRQNQGAIGYPWQISGNPLGASGSNTRPSYEEYPQIARPGTFSRSMADLPGVVYFREFQDRVDAGARMSSWVSLANLPNEANRQSFLHQPPSQKRTRL
jgi:hypothetical protein